MNPCSNKWNKRRRIVKSIRPPPFRKNTHHIPPKGLTAYQTSILLRTAHAVLLYSIIYPLRGQPLLCNVFLIEEAVETRRAARSSPSSESPALIGRRLQGNDTVAGAVTIYPLARASPRRAVNPSRPPIKNPRKTQQAHGRALRAASTPFFMRSGAPSYDYKILSPYNYSVCF